VRARPYQEAALEAFRASKEKAGILALATGLGKSFCAARLPGVLDARRTLVLAHREELLGQLREAFARANPAASIGLERAESWALGTEDVIVASTPTLVASGGRRLERLRPDLFDLVILDEAHHGMAPGSVALWQRLGFMDEKKARVPDPPRRLVGLTATPGRTDGESLRDLFGEITFSYSLPDAIRGGWLVPIEAFTVVTDTSLTGVQTRQGEFVSSQLEAAVDTTARNGAVYDAWDRHARGLSTLVFGVTVKHATSLAACFVANGVDARVVHGQLSGEERRAAFSWFKSTPGAVLCNCQLVDEGTDLPGIEAVVMAAPTRSAIRFGQRIGRGTRLAAGAHDIAESVALGKSRCIVLDVTDSMEDAGRRAFGIADLFNLPKRKVLTGKNVLVELAEQEAEAVAEQQALEQERIKTASRSVDLFAAASLAAERLPRWARFSWIAIGDALYLSLPERARLRILEDALGGWRCERWDAVTKAWARLNPQPTSGEHAFLKTLEAAERWVEVNLGDRSRLLLRDAGWRGRAPSEKQLGLARRVGLEVPETATSGELSQMLDAYFAAGGRMPRRKSA
jgi:ATP-dependent helicase IRC3